MLIYSNVSFNTFRVNTTTIKIAYYKTNYNDAYSMSNRPDYST